MKKTYAKKLTDPRWQKKRLEVLSRDNFTCLICDDMNETLHVHHKSYNIDFNPWDYDLDNFQTLCIVCHNAVEYSKVLKTFTPQKALKIKYGEGNATLYLIGHESRGDLKIIQIFNHVNGVTEHLTTTARRILEDVLKIESNVSNP